MAKLTDINPARQARVANITDQEAATKVLRVLGEAANQAKRAHTRVKRLFKNAPGGRDGVMNHIPDEYLTEVSGMLAKLKKIKEDHSS